MAHENEETEPGTKASQGHRPQSPADLALTAAAQRADVTNWDRTHSRTGHGRRSRSHAELALAAAHRRTNVTNLGQTLTKADQSRSPQSPADLALAAAAQRADAGSWDRLKESTKEFLKEKSLKATFWMLGASWENADDEAAVTSRIMAGEKLPKDLDPRQAKEFTSIGIMGHLLGMAKVATELDPENLSSMAALKLFGGTVKGQSAAQATWLLLKEARERLNRVRQGKESEKQYSSDLVWLSGMVAGGMEAVLLSRIAPKFLKDPSSIVTFAQNSADALDTLSEWQWNRSVGVETANKNLFGADEWGRAYGMRANPPRPRLGWKMYETPEVDSAQMEALLKIANARVAHQRALGIIPSIPHASEHSVRHHIPHPSHHIPHPSHHIPHPSHHIPHPSHHSAPSHSADGSTQDRRIHYYDVYPLPPPGHAGGGFTTKDHVALVHKNEGILPLGKVPEIFAKTIEKAGGTAGRRPPKQAHDVKININVHGTNTAEEFRQKVVPLLRSELVSLFEEMSAALDGSP